MISKQQIKLLRALGQKKYRKQYKMFTAEGAKIAQELLLSNLKVINLYAIKSWLSENTSILAKVNAKIIEEVSEKEMEQITQLSTPGPVLLVVETPVYEPYMPSSKNALSLALESIRDPGNLGTIIRLADWYGLSEIYCSEDCAEAFNPKTIQASMGSISRVKVFYTDLQKLTGNGIPVYAAAASGEINAHKLNAKPPVILLIGNESKGISKELLQKAENKIKIPAFGKAESLNAAVATGILLDNFMRIFKN